MTPLLKTSHLKVPLVIAAPFTVVVFTNALVIGPQPAVSAAILKLATGKGSMVTLTVCVFGQVFAVRSTEYNTTIGLADELVNVSAIAELVPILVEGLIEALVVLLQE